MNKEEEMRHHEETLRIMAACDWTSAINNAKQKVNIEVVEKLLINGESIEEIMEYTGLTEKEIIESQKTL